VNIHLPKLRKSEGRGLNHDGIRVDGSVGKCFGYGAQGGVLIVPGDADSRAGIRLSGADLISARKLVEPLRNDLGCITSRANIKGFAFEYMTSGRASGAKRSGAAAAVRG
jgi:glutamate synthase (NADPH/NADH) large chain